MTYVRKTRDTFELQVNYGFGHGYETECVETTRREARQRRDEYRENCPQYACRIVKKREPIPTTTELVTPITINAKVENHDTYMHHDHHGPTR